MGKELPKEKKWGIKNCRALKCPELRKNEDTEYPEDAQERCQVFNTMPGTLPCCIRDMDHLPPEEFLRHCTWQLHEEWEKGMHNRKTPGPKNCPATCPYKISEQGEVFGKSGEEQWKKKPGTIWRCAFTGGVLGQGLGGSCPCHVLDNPEQDRQMESIRQAILHRFGSSFNRAACDVVGCPDGVIRCKTGDIICPVIKLPFIEIKECPLWRIPAKLLPAPEQETPDERLSRGKAIREEVLENRETMKRMSTRKSSLKEKPAEPEKKTRKKKEPEDLICKACSERNHGHVPDHACAWCKEEQEKKGRRAWTTSLQLGTVHCGDMEVLGEQVPTSSVDVIFTDPPYVKELWENAFAELAMLAARVLKPGGFLFTYAPQAHLDEIMDLLRHTTPMDEGLTFFWIIASLNSGQVAKDHKHNALCLHKPILVFQNPPKDAAMKGARRCFADVVRGFKQKRFHAWQQSVHDVLGIIDRFMVPGEILLDPYAGWGTSLIAANLLGMEWVGFEIEPDRQKIAMQRLQQRPVDLQAFGIEADAPECGREPTSAAKDTSKQEAIEAPEKTTKKRSRIDKPESGIKTEPADPATKARPVELHAACLECEAKDECRTHDPRAGCIDTVKAIKKAVEEKEQKIPNITWCSTIRNCPSVDWEGGICTKTGNLVKDQTYCPTEHLIGKEPKPSKRPKDAGTGGGPQPFVQHCCGTCGHHKGRKTFHESCPRLGELLFKGGTKSAKVLMDETAATPCTDWTEIPRDLYTTVHYDGKDLSPSLGTCPDKCPYKVKSKSSCGFTDQQFLRMESCPTGALQSSPDGQKQQIENMARAMARLSAHLPSEDQCQCFPCPDGVIRCGIGDKNCPFSKNPFDDLAFCPMQNPRRVRQILRERPLKFVKIEKPEEKKKSASKKDPRGRGTCNNCTNSAINVIMDTCPRLKTGVLADDLYEESEAKPCEFWGERQGPNSAWLVGKKPALARSDGPFDPTTFRKKSASKKSKTKEETP
jgi:16S rRNA G966 N2-methylase RsmD